MYIKKGFILLIFVIVLSMAIGIYYGYRTLEFNRSIFTYRDRLTILYNMNELSITPTVMQAGSEFSKTILSQDSLNKIIFYITRIHGEARIPDRKYDFRIAFPKNNIDIYFIDDDSAAILAQLPGKNYKFYIKYDNLKPALEKIYKNNASH